MKEFLGTREIILGLLVVITLAQITNRKFILLLIVVLVYYIYDYKQINKSLVSLFQNISKSKEVPVVMTSQSRIHKREMNYKNVDQDILKYMNQLKRYRKYNKISYDKGVKFMNQFMIVTNMIYKDIPNSRHIYDNAEITYKQGIQEFESMCVSVPSYDFQRSYKKPETHDTFKDYSEKIGTLCKELDRHCYYKMYNIAHEINQDWATKPTIYKSEIIQNDVKASNELSDKYSS